MASGSFLARVQGLFLCTELSDRHCPSLSLGTLRSCFFKHWPSLPSIGESRDLVVPRADTWAAWLLRVWASHLEFPTVGSSSVYEHCTELFK